MESVGAASRVRVECALLPGGVARLRVAWLLAADIVKLGAGSQQASAGVCLEFARGRIRNVPTLPEFGPSGRESPPASRKWLLVLLLILLLGSWVRICDLDERSFSHVESYFPGIGYPDHVSDPTSRLDFWTNLRWALNDVHGPLWYVLMLPYAELFGTSLFVIRAQAVIFGVFSIALMYVLGTLLKDRLTGVLAAAFLAFNGHHLFWSQTARFYAMACMLSLLSTWLLIRSVRDQRKSRWPPALYLGVTCAGLLTLHYFWAVLVTQMLWALLMTLAKEKPSGSLLRGQVLLFIAASPLLTLVVYQARPMFLGDRPLAAVKGYLTFGFLFEPNPIAISSPEWLIWLSAILPWLALLLLGFSVLARKTKTPATQVDEPRAPTRIVLGIATVASCVVILFAVNAAAAVFPHKTTLLRSTVLLPLAACAFAWSVQFFAERRASRFLWLPRVGLHLEHDRLLVILMATVPVSLIAALSLLVPFFAPRAMLLFTPFLLILLAYGVSFVTTKKRKASRVGAGVLLVLLGIAHTTSVRSSLSFPGPADYKTAALGLLDDLEASDWIFLRRHWATTPIFYYLKGEESRFIADDYAGAVRRRPSARIWVIRPDYLQMPKLIEDALRDKRQSDSIVAHGVRVDLYDP